MEQYVKQGLISDSKVLDIRQVDIATAKMLESNGAEIPVFVVSFATQEVLLFRNAKSGEVVVGAENRVEQCTYAAVLTRVEEELDDELTGGWKVVEVRALSFWRYLLVLTLNAPRWPAGRHEHIFEDDEERSFGKVPC